MTLLESMHAGPIRPVQLRIIAICILIAMIDGYEVVAMPFSIPAIAGAWGLANAQVGYLLSASIFGMALGAVFISPLADRIGRRNHLLLCLPMISVATILSGFAQTLWQLVAIRAVAGLFIGAMISSLNIIVSEYAPDAKRGLIMGLYGVGLPLGSALAGFAISPLIEVAGWRAPFFLGGALTLVMLAITLPWMPESIDYLLHRRPKGALVTYNRIARQMGIAEVSDLPPAPQGAVRGRARDLLGPDLLARTLVLWVAYASLISAFYFANTWTAKIVADATGDAHLGIVTGTLIQAGGVLGAVLYGLLTLRVHPRLATVVVVGLGGIAFWVYAMVSGQVSAAMMLAFAIGVCTNGGCAAFFAISPSIYPTTLRGTGVGLMIGFGRGVAILVPILTGYMLSGGWAPVELYRIFAGVMVFSALAVVALDAVMRRGEAVPQAAG